MRVCVRARVCVWCVVCSVCERERKRKTVRVCVCVYVCVCARERFFLYVCVDDVLTKHLLVCIKWMKGES